MMYLKCQSCGRKQAFETTPDGPILCDYCAQQEYTEPAQSNRKQRIEEMCKVMISDYMAPQDPDHRISHAESVVDMARHIIDKIDALDGGGE
jgi:hypothetical protein